MALANIYQIFYDKESKQALDPAFIPLDNTANERPDWYEFWVIRNFLKNQTLDERNLYGFLSPSFGKKTGIRGTELLSVLGQVPHEIDAVLFSIGWDQIAYFKNVFEQGDYWHPDLMEASKQFFMNAGVGFDPEASIGHSMNSVFSNYFVAKPAFWRSWLEVADCLWDICETQTGALADLLKSSGRYRSGGQDATIKIFIQERIASVLLAIGQFQVVSLEVGHAFPVFDRLFTEDLRTRRLLNACDTMKLEADFSKNPFFVKAYEACRKAIDFKG